MIFSLSLVLVYTALGTTTSFYSPECIEAKCMNEAKSCVGGTDRECRHIVECFMTLESIREDSNGMYTSTTGTSSANTNKCFSGVSMDATESALTSCAKRNGCLKTVKLHDVSSTGASFVELGSKLAQYEAEEKEAAAEKDKAEVEFLESKKRTDELLSKVHAQLSSLTKSLQETATEQKQELSAIESDRAKESKALDETEKKLEAMAKGSFAAPASFVQTSDSSDPEIEKILAPLMKAAADARAFSETLKKEAEADRQRLSVKSSFVETSKGGSVDSSLAHAEAALKQLNQNIANQRKQLGVEEQKAAAEHQRLLAEQKKLFAQLEMPVSFAQLADSDTSSTDPLSPQSLAQWKSKFESLLESARKAAGITDSTAQSSLMQTTDSDVSAATSAAEQKLADDEKNVKRLEAVYQEKMAKLKADNTALMQEAKDEMSKAAEMEQKMKDQFKDVAVTPVSFVQQSEDDPTKFDPSKEEETIRQLQRKWEVEAEKLAHEASQKDSAQSQLQQLMEQQRVDEDKAKAELDRLSNKLTTDIAKMKKDISLMNVPAPASFIQLTGAPSDSEKLAALADPLVKAKALLSKLDEMIRSPVLGHKSADQKTHTSSFLEEGSDKASQALSKAEANLHRLEDLLKKQTARLTEIAKEANNNKL